MYYTSPVMFIGRNYNNTPVHLLDLTEIWRWLTKTWVSNLLYSLLVYRTQLLHVNLERDLKWFFLKRSDSQQRICGEVLSQRMLQIKHFRHSIQIFSLALPFANAGQAVSTFTLSNEQLFPIHVSILFCIHQPAERWPGWYRIKE